MHQGWAMPSPLAPFDLNLWQFLTNAVNKHNCFDETDCAANAANVRNCFGKPDCTEGDTLPMVRPYLTHLTIAAPAGS